MNAQEAKKLEKKVLAKLQEYIGKETVIAGISGGADSVFLLHFLQQLPCKTIAAHLNHQLRDEADADQKFVEKIAKNPESHKEKIAAQKGNLEENGRKARYKFFNKLAKKHQAKFIITAHHADDNLETALLNFIRGASLQGLSGMQELDGNLLRPLLQFSKKEITEYLALKKIAFEKDISNDDNTYSRNFLRNEVIPQLQKLNPSIAKTYAKNAKNLREIQLYLNEEAKKHITTHKNLAKPFKEQSLPLQKTILRQMYQELIGNTRNIENIHIQECLALIHTNIGNKKKKLGKATLTIGKGLVQLEKN